MSDFDDRDGVELPPKSAQSDDLRTRIAAAIYRHAGFSLPWEEAMTPLREDYLSVADAVIRELALWRDGVRSVDLPPKQRVLIGGKPESVYRSGDEIVISGHMRLYRDEVQPLARALIAALFPGDTVEEFEEHLSGWEADDE